MSTFTSAVRTFIADEEGVTALEYGMIAALIAVMILTTVSTLGVNMKEVFNKVATALA